MNSKKAFLTRFFSESDSLKYAVIDIDKNLEFKIENDIDILVDKEDITQFVDNLRSLCFQSGWKLSKMNVSPRVHSIYEGKYAVINTEDSFCVIQFDIWVGYHWRSLPLILGDYCFKFDSTLGYKRLVDDQAVLLNSLKDLIYKREFSKKTVERIKRVNSNWDPSFLSLSRSMSNRFVAKVRNPGGLVPRYFIIRLRLNILSYNLYVSRGKVILRFVRYVLILLRQRLISKRRLVVSFEGPDGSGKTSISKILLDSEFVRFYFNNNIRFHTDFKILPRLSRLKFSKNSLVSRPKRDTKPIHDYYAWVYPTYYTLDYLLGRLYLSIFHRDTFVFFDRHFNEFFVQNSFANVSRRYLGFLSKFVTKPDLSVLVIAEPETIYERKQELTLDEIRKQIKIYTDICDNNLNGRIIKNDGSIEEASREVLVLLIKKFCDL